MEFKHISNPEEIAASFAVMRELRPHLENVDAYQERVLRQQHDGYRLLAACRGDEIVGLAGYRHMENLIHGRFTYVDDLVVRASEQRSSIGARLIDQVREQARADGRTSLVLDTGLANALAQRFYFRNGLLARGLHFSQQLGEVSR